VFGHTGLLIVYGAQNGLKKGSKSKGFKGLIQQLLRFLDVGIFVVLCVAGFVHLLFSVQPELILNMPYLQTTLLEVYSAAAAKKVT